MCFVAFAQPVADWFKASDTATTVQGFLVFTDQACPSATITPSSPAVLVDNLTKLEDLEDIEFEFSGVATSDLILTYRCREAFVLSKTVEVISVEGAPLSFTPPAWLITSIKSVSPTRVSITLAVDDKLTSATVRFEQIRDLFLKHVAALVTPCVFWTE